MRESPSAFLRGAAAIMAADLASTPRSGLNAQLCGDVHAANFGGFAAPDRNLVFDLNDFDETAPAAWEWDIKRLAASFAVLGRDGGFGARKRREVVLAAGGSYRRAMRQFAGMRTVEVWYARLDLSGNTRSWRRFCAGQPANGSIERLGRAGGRTACPRSRNSPKRSTASRASSVTHR